MSPIITNTSSHHYHYININHSVNHLAILLRLPRKHLSPLVQGRGLLPSSEDPAEGRRGPAGPAGALLPCPPACLRSGAYPSHRGPGPQLPTLPQGHSAHCHTSGKGRDSLRWPLHPRVTQDGCSCYHCFPCLPLFLPLPRLSGHVPVSGGDWQQPRVPGTEVAESRTSLVWAAALGRPAAPSSLLPVTHRR